MSVARDFGYDPFGAHPRTPAVGDLVYSTNLPNGAGKVVATTREPDQYGRAVYRLKILWTNGTVTNGTNLSDNVALLERMIGAKEKALVKLMKVRDAAIKL